MSWRHFENWSDSSVLRENALLSMPIDPHHLPFQCMVRFTVLARI